MGRRIKAQKVFGAGGVKRVLPPQEAKAKASAAVPAQKRQREASQQAQPRKKKGKHGDADDDDASPEETPVNHVTQTPSALFFQYNAALGPPYQVIVDTNFINFSIKCKIDIYKGMLDCLYARCVPCISDCVLAELEKLGERYRVALRLAKDSRFERLPCLHSGTYADDCICQRVQQHKCYIVATCDRALKRRIRKIPGVPIMYVHNHKYSIERLPEATMGGAPSL